MKILEQDTDLGKCIICKQMVSTDDEVWFNKASVMYNERIICGVCLVNLNGASIEAMANFDEEDKLDTSEIMMNKWGVYVDPKTGKIVSKGIREAKV